MLSNVKKPFRARNLIAALAAALVVLTVAQSSQPIVAYAQESPDYELNLTVNNLDEIDADELSFELDSYLQTNFPRTHEPGIAVAVVTSQGIAYMNTFGTCDDASDSFYIGSLSKSMCAVAIMQLVEEGRLDLDVPAMEYAPEYLISPQVTVRMLLNQTSGFGYYESLNQATVGDSFGEFSYANANYDLLGRIVEHVSGEEYSEYLTRHIFAPLNMIDSSAQGLRTTDVLGNLDGNDDYGLDPSTAEYSDTRDVLGHRNYFGIYLDDGFQHDEDDDAWGGPSSGYVSSSIRDMANYLQMYLDGGKNVLDYGSVVQIFMSRVPDPDGDAYYGMGWTSYYWDDELVLCHDGDVETNVASMCILPERGIGIVVLGDGYDSVAGNGLFFELASGVLDIAMGYSPQDLDSSTYEMAHTQSNEAWLIFFAICAIPLAASMFWAKFASMLIKRRSKGMLTATVCFDVAFFALIGAWIVQAPRRMGIPWRDISTFDPTISCGLTIGVSLVAVAIIVRIAIALHIFARSRSISRQSPET